MGKLTMKVLEDQNKAQQVQIDNLCRIIRDAGLNGSVKQKDAEGNVSYTCASEAADMIKDRRQIFNHIIHNT